MPRGCHPRSTEELRSRSPSLGAKIVLVTCAGCGKSFELATRHQTGAVGSKKVFCSEQCKHTQDLADMRKEEANTP